MLPMLNTFRSRSRPRKSPGRVGAMLGRIRAWACVAGAALLSHGAALADSPGYELGPQDKIRVSVIEWFTGAG